MDDASECWLPAVGWEGLYEVSDLGRVRSLPLPGPYKRGTRRGRILKLNPDHRGYLRVMLYRLNHQGRKNAFVHRLVAEAFLGPCPIGMQIRHGPLGKLDNRAASLCYGTKVDDAEDRTRDHCYHAKLTRAVAMEIRRRLVAGGTAKVLAGEYDVNESTIYKIRRGERWSPA
jgi:NUMOD4 motif/HNH endonuclease